jgi:hypothetical protein
MAQLSLALLTPAPLSVPFPAPVAQPQRVLLTSPEDEATAEAREAIIKPVLAYKADPSRFGLLRLKDGTPVTSYTRMAAWAAESARVERKAIFRWIELYKAGGKPALANRKRSDKDTSRFFTRFPKAGWLSAYLHLNCQQSCTVAYEAILRDRELLDIPEDQLPSYDTVRMFLRSTPAALATYAREGKKAYRDRMSPYLKRQFTDVYANEVWIGDHMIHDVECMNDIFEDAEYGAPIRIRFTAWMDYRSRMFVGESWCWEGSSRSIAAALRRGIIKHGPPENFYVDNGKDYRKIGRGARPGYITSSPLEPQNWWRDELEFLRGGFIARLGSAITFCLPHHPQAKAIEANFRGVHECFDKGWPTYTSGNPFTRPDATEARMMHHRQLLAKGRVAESHHPKASQFILACLAWLEERADTVHEGEGMNGQTPRQVFEENLNPRQKPTPDAPTLALLLAEHKVRQVRESVIHLDKRRYQPVDQAGWTTLHALNEEQVIVAYDPADGENAAALDMDGHFLAWLQCEELVKFAPGDPETQAKIAESMAQRRRLEKHTRETLTTISLIARQNGAQSPLEAMASRLQLPASTDLAGVVTQRAPRLTPDKPTNAAPATPAQAARMFLERQKA